MNTHRCSAVVLFAGAAACLANSSWAQKQSSASNEAAEHRETIELFQAIERRLARIDRELGDAADLASPDGDAALRTIRSDGTFVLSSMDRLLEIQVHHSGGA